MLQNTRLYKRTQIATEYNLVQTKLAVAAKYNVPESSVFGIATRYNQQQSKRTLSRGLAKRGYKHNKCTAQADGFGVWQDAAAAAVGVCRAR